MKTVPLKDLEVGKKIDYFIYHQSGNILHKPGDEISLANLALMEECDIQTVTLVKPDEDAGVLTKKLLKKAVAVEDITLNETCPVTLFDDHETVIIEQGTMIVPSIIQGLTEKSVKELYFNKDQQEMQNFQFTKYLSLCESDLFESISAVRILEHPKERQQRQDEEERKKTLIERKKEIFDPQKLRVPDELLVKNRAIDISTQNVKNGMKESQNLKVPAQSPDIMQISQWTLESRSVAAKEKYSAAYGQWVERLQKIFVSFKANQEVAVENVYQITNEIIDLFLSDSYYCLNLTNSRYKKISERNLEVHCVNTCIIAAGMGILLGYNGQQVVEIAMDALLHDVGHILTYRQLFNKEKLDSSEQKKFDEHSIIGLSIIKNLSAVPLSLPFVIYQHHERMNGSGRILHCMGDRIHDFSRLIGVADEFDSLCQRKTPFGAMSMVIGSARGQQLDAVYAKTALILFSLFPLGSIVQLSNNSIGKVVGTNGTNFKQPYARLLFSMQGKQLQEIKTKELIDLKERKEIQIVKDIVHPALGEKIALGF
ncbi:MAG: HD domain-containing protein [Chitinivibrionales bacterium]|nr:HD domain-containing protein [Chitinivibrionales bacterium]